MPKTILITGATDGIGLITAEKLAELGHNLLIHGRSEKKLKAVEAKLLALGSGNIQSYLADLADLKQVATLAKTLVNATHSNQTSIDVIINNAGIYKTSQPITKDNLDIRFVVNTLAPYLLTKQLLPVISGEGRVVNVSSAAQSPVDLDAVTGKKHLDDPFTAYAQSKLALTMWSHHLAQTHGSNGPTFIAVNPGSLLASKMVKDGFGVEGNDLNIGANILLACSLDDQFQEASGKYFDNDIGDFSPAHPDTLDKNKCDILVDTIERLLTRLI